MEAETKIELQRLMVDGGISSNNFILAFLSDLLQKAVVNIGMADVSALGAAYLAGLQQKIFKGLEHVPQPKTEKTVITRNRGQAANGWYEGWKKALRNE